MSVGEGEVLRRAFLAPLAEAGVDRVTRFGRPNRAPLYVVLPHAMLVTHWPDRQNYVEGLGEVPKQAGTSPCRRSA